MGTIVMAADKVIEAADKTVAHILATRETRDAKAVVELIKRSMPGKFRKFFGGKPLTKEQATRKLCEDHWGFFPSIYAYEDLDKAKKLRKLAEHGDPVTLNEEDISVLF